MFMYANSTKMLLLGTYSGLKKFLMFLASQSTHAIVLETPEISFFVVFCAFVQCLYTVPLTVMSRSSNSSL